MSQAIAKGVCVCMCVCECAILPPNNFGICHDAGDLTDLPITNFRISDASVSLEQTQPSLYHVRLLNPGCITLANNAKLGELCIQVQERETRVKLCRLQTVTFYWPP